MQDKPTVLLFLYSLTHPRREPGIAAVALPEGSRAKHGHAKREWNCPDRVPPFTAKQAATADPIAAPTAKLRPNPHGRRSAAARGGPRATRRARGAHRSAAAERPAERAGAPATGAGKATRAERGRAATAPAAAGAAAPPRGASRQPAGARDTAPPADEQSVDTGVTNRSSAQGRAAARAQSSSAARTDERNSLGGSWVGRYSGDESNPEKLQRHPTGGRGTEL